MDGQKKVGLALGAGGARGMCHLGVLKALKEKNVEVYCVAGSSMGAIAGGLFAAGVPYEKIDKMAHSVTQRLIGDLHLLPKTRSGLFRGRRVMKAFNGLVGDLKIEDCPVKYCATAVDIESGKLKILDGGLLKDAMRASSSIPGVFIPWKIDGRKYIDGGILCRVPIQQVRDMGADVVIGVDALGPVRKKFAQQGVVAMLERFFDITNWELSKDKLDADLLITPDMGHKSGFKFKDHDAAIEAGYKAAKRAMPKILKLLQ